MNLRCFIALKIPDAVRARLVLASSSLVDIDRRWSREKWVPPENLHVTAVFLGNIASSRLDEVALRLASAAEQSPPFDLVEPRIHAVPSPGRARMIWCAFTDPSGGGTELSNSLAGVAGHFGIPVEERPFMPHVTLCRAREPRPLSRAALSAADDVVRAGPDGMSVVSATLCSSRLTPHGPEYEDLAVWQLRGATRT